MWRSNSELLPQWHSFTPEHNFENLEPPSIASDEQLQAVFNVRYWRQGTGYLYTNAVKFNMNL